MIKFDRLRKKCSRCGYDHGERVGSEEVFTCEKCRCRTQAQWPPLGTIQRQLKKGDAWEE